MDANLYLNEQNNLGLFINKVAEPSSPTDS